MTSAVTAVPISVVQASEPYVFIEDSDPLNQVHILYKNGYRADGEVQLGDEKWVRHILSQPSYPMQPGNDIHGSFYWTLVTHDCMGSMQSDGWVACNGCGWGTDRIWMRKSRSEDDTPNSVQMTTDDVVEVKLDRKNVLFMTQLVEDGYRTDAQLVEVNNTHYTFYKVKYTRFLSKFPVRPNQDVSGSFKWELVTFDHAHNAQSDTCYIGDVDDGKRVWLRTK